MSDDDTTPTNWTPTVGDPFIQTDAKVCDDPEPFPHMHLDLTIDKVNGDQWQAEALSQGLQPNQQLAYILRQIADALDSAQMASDPAQGRKLH